MALPSDKNQLIQRMLRNHKDEVALCIIYNAFLIGVRGLALGLLWYTLHLNYQRQGVGTEVACRMIDYAFKMFDWSCIKASMFSDNPVAVMVLEKLVACVIQPSVLWSLGRDALVVSWNFFLPRLDWQQRKAPVINMVRPTICSLAMWDLDNFMRTGGEARVAAMILRAMVPLSLKSRLLPRCEAHIQYVPNIALRSMIKKNAWSMSRLRPICKHYLFL